MRPEQRKMTPSERRIDEMKRIRVYLTDKSYSLWELVEQRSVVSRIEYFAIIGRPTHQVKTPWIEERVVHDLGLVFGDGLELRGVDVRHYNFFKDAAKVERKELAPVKMVGEQMERKIL